MYREGFTQDKSAAALRPLPIDIISIQSQVVYGSVGNNVAFPTLLSHGLNVATVPTVLLSNTPHYKTLYGGVVPLDWFEGYLHALSQRGALKTLQALLVGYIGSPEQAQILSRWVSTLGANRKKIRVIVDPVIGDHDVGVHVSSGMVEAWRQYMLPVADGIVPNSFELQQLTNRPVGNVDQIIVAARELLTDTLRWVVVTSAAPDACASNEMQVMLVTQDDAWVLKHERIAVALKGTGDLFTAELTAQIVALTPLKTAIRAAANKVIQVLEATRRRGTEELILTGH